VCVQLLLQCVDELLIAFVLCPVTDLQSYVWTAAMLAACDALTCGRSNTLTYVAYAADKLHTHKLRD
jgi:hypothetical protein